MRKLIIVGAVGLALVGCQGGAANTGDKIASVVTSPAGASLLNQINTGFAPPVQKVIDKINTGLAVVESDKKYICGAMSMANGLFSVAADVGLIASGQVSTEKTAMVAVDDLCASAIGDVKSAVNTVA